MMPSIYYMGKTAARKKSFTYNSLDNVLNKLKANMANEVKKSRRRPAAVLLRLATLWTSGRLSRNKGRVWTMLKLKRLPTHITPEVLNSLTGLERVGP